jgi:NADH-quinone oxidoreductase subunit L
MSSWLWLIPTLPLAGFLLNGLLRLPRAAAAVVGCAGPILSFFLSVAATVACPVRQRVFDWISVESFRIAFGLNVDPLAAIMILVVTGVGSLIHIYSVGYMRADEGFRRYFAFLNLFMFSMLLLVLGDSIVLMFVGWEGVGLCSYLLIGFWYKDLKNADAGKKAFITNRVGDFGFLLGIFCLWQAYGTLDFLAMGVPKNPDMVVLAGLFLFVGACGKSAQIPLHVWLPDAMAGPTPVSALIHAATMVTAGVYMMARMSFVYVAGGPVLETVGAVAAATALVAALIACAQNDIKKILAYSTISQLGFMFAGAAASAFAGGIFHVVTHAFFKALLFLGAGAVIHALGGEQDIRKMGGLRKPLRLVFWTFLIGAAALAGFPGSAGFFSKDLILASVIERGMTLTFACLFVTAAVTAFYSTRLVILAFLGEGHAHHVHKPGLLMTLPLVVLAVCSALGGMLEHPVERFLHAAPVGDAPSVIALLASLWAFSLGVLAACLAYGILPDLPKAFVESGAGRLVHLVVSNKFYIDELYEVLVVAPIRMGAAAVWFVVDRVIIDAVLVHGAGRLTCLVGGVLRRPHTGSIGAGLATFLVGAVVVLAYLFYRFAT